MNDAKTAPKVEDYLNKINYTVPKDYIPSDFALQFINFIKLANDDIGEENKSPLIHYYMLDTLVSGGSHIANLCHRGIAKALNINTRIPTPKGWKRLKDIRPYDVIFNEQGKPTVVLNTSEIFLKDMYRITLEDGRSLDVSEDHINVILQNRVKKQNGKIVNYITRRNITTKDLLKEYLFIKCKKTLEYPEGRQTIIWVPLAKPVEYPELNLPIEPYKVGLVAETVKNIPSAYKIGSIRQRLALLQGIITSGGTLHRNGVVTFKTDSKRLSIDICEIVSSLGGSALKIDNYDKNKYNKNTYKFRININLPLFITPNKIKKQKKQSYDKVAIKSIRKIPSVKSQCLMVNDPEHTFLAGNYIPTHNTTLMGEYLILYLALYEELPKFGSVDLILYVSDSIENGVKNMRKNLEFRWENSDFLREYIPNTRFTDVRWEFKNLNGTSLVVRGYGAKTGVRGTKEKGRRPQMAILDDLISDEDARSATIISTVEDTVYKAVEYALHPKQKMMIWSGTPFNSRDPLYKAVESGVWVTNVFPICEQYPCEEKNFKGSWPDRFPYSYVKEQYRIAMALGKIDTFNQELMLRIMSNEERLILDKDIMWYLSKTLINNKSSFNFYITTDFATSEKEAADYSVISVWAYDNSGNWYWIDGICKRQLMDKNIDDLFRLVQLWQPQQVGLEISGQQAALIPWLQKEMLTRNIYFTLASENNEGDPGIRPVTQKLERFNIMAPVFKAKKMFFPEDLKHTYPIVEAMDELSLVSKFGIKSKHDDFIDTISMLGSLTPWKPSLQVRLEKSDNGLWHLEDFDIESDTLSSYIH